MSNFKLGPEAVDRLIQARDRIRVAPETYHQRYWHVTSTCGTFMCIAGLLCTMEGFDITDWTTGEISMVATELLGLDEELDIATQLFMPGHNDTRLVPAGVVEAMYGHDKAKRADAGARYIDAFLSAYT